MATKRLNWSYGDDYFSKKSSRFEKVYQGHSRKIQSQIDDTATHVGYNSSSDNNKYYETLRNNLILPVNGSSEIPRLIALTSCTNGEGVTTISTNLAITFAHHSDGPVLFVDTNFPRPSAHEIFGVNFSPGLGEILIEECESSAAIQPSSIHNLHILTTGKVHADLIPKFDSPLYTELFEKWRRDYRFVIFDTSSMQSDGNYSVPLASLVDGVILVIEAEHLRWEVAQRVKERLIQSKGKILGVVINKREFHVPRWLYKTL